MKHMGKTGFLCAVGRKLRALRSDESGYAYMFTGLAFTAILGFSGAALDMANWYFERRNTQNIADAAAVAGTIVDIDAASFTDVEAAALEEAVRNGFEDDGVNLVTVTDSAAGSSGGITPRVEVVVQRQIPVYLISAFVGTEVPISARAVGGLRALGPQCVVALNEGADRAVEFSGNTAVDVGCGVISNSDSEEALYIGGNASLTANPAQAFGDISIVGSGDLDSTFPPMPYSPRMDDPLADTIYPMPNGGCDSGDITVASSGSLALAPSSGDGAANGYRICGTLKVHGDLTLAPGTYYVDGGNFVAEGTATITGDDVTIVMTGATAGDVGDIHIRGGAAVTLTAPDTGDWAGIVFYQDPIADGSTTNHFRGGATMDLTGAVYFPTGNVDYSGGADAPGCTMIVADTVSFTGDTFLKNDLTECETVGLGDGLGGKSQQTVVLVE